jgi:hypothetical protein
MEPVVRNVRPALTYKTPVTVGILASEGKNGPGQPCVTRWVAFVNWRERFGS